MSTVLFDRAQAETYDQRFERLAVLRDALHLVTRLGLEELPSNAHLLCVGAGTGAEILDLAPAFPGWRFTAVDPSGPMLERCQAKLDAAGLSSRCTLHEGTADTLPDHDLYDGATAILVSQFLVDPRARTGFFQAIAERLRPGAPLVTADLALPSAPDGLLELWKRAWRYAGVPEENVARIEESFRGQVAVLPPTDVAALIREGGFEAPLPCFQTILIHGWLARRPYP